jgi:ABC-type transporter Mla subunit MlaD
MIDPPPNGDTGTPRWVKVFGIVALVVVVLVVVVAVTGRGGEHGPGRHAPAVDTGGGHTGPPPGVTHADQP